MTSLATVPVCKEKEDENLSHAEKVPVMAPVTGRTMSDDEAEAVQITYGADCEYIGVCGSYRLGRVMVIRSEGESSELTVLEW